MSLARAGSSFEVEGEGKIGCRQSHSGEPQERRVWEPMYKNNFTPNMFIDLYILFLGWSRLQGRVKQGSKYGNMKVSQVPEGVWLH